MSHELKYTCMTMNKNTNKFKGNKTSTHFVVTAGRWIGTSSESSELSDSESEPLKKRDIVSADLLKKIKTIKAAPEIVPNGFWFGPNI